MRKRSLLLKIIAIANALVVTGVFVGCPNPNQVIVHIAPNPGDFQIKPPADQPPPPPPFVTIAPYGGNFQQLVPPPPPTPLSPDSRNDKRSP
jgi:hypothetical protein